MQIDNCTWIGRWVFGGIDFNADGCTVLRKVCVNSLLFILMVLGAIALIVCPIFALTCILSPSFVTNIVGGGADGNWDFTHISSLFTNMLILGLAEMLICVLGVIIFSAFWLGKRASLRRVPMLSKIIGGITKSVETVKYGIKVVSGTICPNITFSFGELRPGVKIGLLSRVWTITSISMTQGGKDIVVVLESPTTDDLSPYPSKVWVYLDPNGNNRETTTIRINSHTERSTLTMLRLDKAALTEAIMRDENRK